jgi:hypothetical protein
LNYFPEWFFNLASADRFIAATAVIPRFEMRGLPVPILT